MKYVIDGEPQPQLRPRWGNGHVYDPQALFKTMISLSIAKQHGKNPPHTGPIGVYIKFYLTVPPGKKNKERLYKHHIFKPDIDNLSKLLLDCLTKSRIIKDDCIVCELGATKSYHPKGSTVFEIIELTDGKKESTEAGFEANKTVTKRPKTSKVTKKE